MRTTPLVTNPGNLRALYNAKEKKKGHETFLKHNTEGEVFFSFFFFLFSFSSSKIVVV